MRRTKSKDRQSTAAVRPGKGRITSTPSRVPTRSRLRYQDAATRSRICARPGSSQTRALGLRPEGVPRNSGASHGNTVHGGFHGIAYPRAGASVGEPVMTSSRPRLKVPRLLNCLAESQSAPQSPGHRPDGDAPAPEPGADPDSRRDARITRVSGKGTTGTQSADHRDPVQQHQPYFRRGLRRRRGDGSGPPQVRFAL
jgi:hypothetical protein